MSETDTSSRAASLKAQADKHRDSGNFQAAVESYRAALALMPRFWQAHANLSVVLSKTGDHDSSVFHAQQAVEIMPDMAQLLDNLGVIYREAGRYPEAVAAHKQALEKNSELISAYFNLGLGHLKNDALGEALQAFEKAIAINPDAPQVYLSAGNVLLQQNRPGEAEGYFRSALKLSPSQPAALHNLGQCLQDQGKLDEAITAYQQVVQLNPGSAGSYFNLGVAQQEKGLLDEAIESYSRAIALDSNLGDAYFNMGAAYAEQQKPVDAAACYRNALRCDPQHEEALIGLGDALRNQGALEDAAAYLQEALALNPSSFKANIVLGNLLRDNDEMDKAVAAFRQALVIDPRSKEAHNNLGLALSHTQERMKEAISAYERAIEIDPGFKEAHFNLGRAREKEGLLDAASSALERAVDIDPEYVEALHQLGVISNEQGDRDKALAYCRKALSIDPEHSWTHLLIAKTKKHKEHDPEIAAMEKLYGREGNSSEQNRNYAFGLAKVYEDLGEYETAFGYMSEGNRLARAAFEYFVGRDKDYFDAVKELFDEKLLNMSPVSGIPDKTPFFIVGMPRSGTSLTEQILASHPQVCGGGELLYLDVILKQLSDSESRPYALDLTDDAVCSRIGSEYIRRIRDHDASASHIINKLPGNFLHIGYIRKALPNAKIIHCRRDPMDNCLSILKHDFKDVISFAYDMEELGRYYLLYEDLMRHWHEAMPGVIYDIQYEELVADQEQQTRRLLEFCGLPWDDACLSFYKTERRVATASFIQVRQPIYNDSVQLWKRYESQLEPLRRIIESVERD
jgi:tetratricopeptide (TPR) repeat protein